RWAIGPKPNSNTGSAQLQNGRNAARDHHVARRVVYAAGLPLRQSLAVCAIHKNAMCGYDIWSEYADLVKVLHRRHSVLLLAVLPFFFHLSNVDQNRRMKFARQRCGILKRLL